MEGNKPYFDSKCRIGEERVILVEGDNIISEDDDISSTFNAFFNRITDSLPITQILALSVYNLDPISSAIDKYANHPSIKAIKSRPSINSHFEIEI